jgi:hypothetical protein
MGNFDRLIAAAIEHLRGRLLSRGWSSTEIDALTGRIERLNFPGLLALLGAGSQRTGLLGAELLSAAAQDVAFEASPDEELGPGAIQRFLKDVLHRHVSLSDIPVRESEGEALKRERFKQGVAALARRSGMLPTLDQTERIASLLSNGEFFRDIGSATAATLSTARTLPLALADDIRWSPRAIRLLLALWRDLRGTPASVWKVFAQLRSGELDDPPAVLSHTLTALYATASLAAISEMIRTLLAKDRESFRLAVVLYARSAGIPIEEADLDVLRESVFNTDEPDLGPALLHAVERLEANLGRDFMIGVLDRLEPRRDSD